MQERPPPKGGMTQKGATNASHDRIITILLKGGIIS